MGLSGGLLIVWNSTLLKVRYHFSGVGFIGLCALVQGSNMVCHLVNVYSPCTLEGKRRVWQDLVMSKRGFGGEAWCMAGDFNAVSHRSERKGLNNQVWLNEIDEFNLFISDMDLVDIPVSGKVFTWYKADGSAMSRLDRFLISESIISGWQVSAQWVGDRDISDHCPIWLVCSNSDWGPARNHSVLITVGWSKRILKYL